MENQLITERTPELVAMEIRFYQKQAERALLSAAVEIGKRLVEVKEMLPHGQFTNWLTTNVEYSHSTANNLMNLYKNYGLVDGESKYANLSYSQALALLPIPAEEREAFVEEHATEEMSVSELKVEVQRYKESMEAVLEVNNERIDEITNLEAEKNKLAKDVIFAKNEAEDMRQRKNQTEEQLKRAKEVLQGAKDRIKSLEEQLEQPVTVEAVIPPEVTEELERLRKQVEDREGSLAVAEAQTCVRLYEDVIIDALRKIHEASKCIRDRSIRRMIFFKLADQLESYASDFRDNAR